MKERFGLLRIYFQNDDTGGASRSAVAFGQLVSRLEGESARICEQCGAPAELRAGRWYKTLCNAHAEGRPPLPTTLDQGDDA